MATTQPARTRFPTTQWAEVEALKALSADERRASLGEFLERYQPAMRAFVRAFFRGLDDDAAAEWVQDFTTDQIIDRDLVARASADRGQLRAFLRVALRNYCLERMRKDRSQPRHVDLDGDAITAEADESFDQNWVKVVLDEATRRVERRFESREQQDYLTLLRVKILGLADGSAGTMDNKALAENLGTTPQRMRSKLSKVRVLFVRTVREVVKEYAASQANVDEELAELLRRIS